MWLDKFWDLEYLFTWGSALSEEGERYTGFNLLALSLIGVSN